MRFIPPYEGSWQPTGDIGFIDAQSCAHFLGRGDNMMKSGGENVFPDEVAKVLLSMPQVADAVVLGLPDERMGERVAEVIVATRPYGPAISRLPVAPRLRLTRFRGYLHLPMHCRAWAAARLTWPLAAVCC